MSSPSRALLFSIVVLLLAGCSVREEGPVERIGRGIDEMMRGARELSEQPSGAPAEARRSPYSRSADDYYDDGYYGGGSEPRDGRVREEDEQRERRRRGEYGSSYDGDYHH